MAPRGEGTPGFLGSLVDSTADDVPSVENAGQTKETNHVPANPVETAPPGEMSSEKSWLDTLKEYKDFIPSVIPGNKNVYAVVDISDGVNIMGNISTNCIYLDDHSNNICDLKEINCYTGRDRSRGIFKYLNINAMSDFQFGGEKTFII